MSSGNNLALPSSSHSSSSTPGTLTLFRSPVSSSNPWISFDITAPSESDCRAFDKQHGLDSAFPGNWALSPHEQGLECLLSMSLSAVHFETSIYNIPTGQSFGCSLLDCLDNFIAENSLSKSITGFLYYTLCQAMMYIDSWSNSCHTMPNLFKYKQFDLVPSPVGFPFNPRIQEQKQLMHLLCTTIFIDCILAAQFFFSDPLESWAQVEACTHSYIESPELLIPKSHSLYQYSQSFPAGTIGRVCQQALQWCTYFDDLPKPLKKGQTATIFEDFGKVPNKLLKDIVKSDQRAAEGIAQGNVSQACFSLITTWGQTNVRLSHFVPHFKLTSFLGRWYGKSGHIFILRHPGPNRNVQIVADHKKVEGCHQSNVIQFFGRGQQIGFLQL